MKMLYHILILLVASTISCGLPRQSKQQVDNGQKLEKEVTTVREQRQQKELAPQPQSDKPQQGNPQIVPDGQQQPVFPQLPYYLEPLSPYPDYDFLKKQQLYPRVQPQIVFYGPGGQGQPILINPGSPPGNFLVPHQPQPGPNVIIRDIPQRPVFVAGYPKPAHIPPIEKDAEEIPTNPAKIPPFPRPSARKPEKLETFNEDSGYPGGDAGVLAGPDRHPQLIPGTNLKPGHRFFILNGEDLFTNYPFQNNQEVNLKYGQPEDLQLQQYQDAQVLPQKEFDLNTIPIQAVLLRNAVRDQISNVQDLNAQEKLPENLVSLNQAASPQAYFRSALPLNFADIGNVETIGQFRFAPSNEPYLSLEGEDIENDSVVIDAKADGASSDADSESSSDAPAPHKAPEPSTAQAAPGAIALAGPGGVAGAAPKGTALVGRGGLAVASPQATAVAGTRKSEDKIKKPAIRAK